MRRRDAAARPDGGMRGRPADAAPGGARRLRRGGPRPAAVAALVAAVLVAGCGVSVDGASRTPVARRALADAAAPARAAQLPVRTAGVVRVDGQSGDPVTAALVDAYRASGVTDAIAVADRGEAAAFRGLCDGEVDVVDSSRPISAREYERCRRNGVRPVQLQLASDAAVLAIRSETDVGADCLSLADVRTIFRAGSPVDSWAQVGYDKAPERNWGAPPMHVTGPAASTTLFRSFVGRLLGDPDPSLTSVRSDYRAADDDRGVRLAVVGSDADAADAPQAGAAKARLAALRKAIADGQDAVDDATAEVAKGYSDGRSATDQAADQARLVAAQGQLDDLEQQLPGLEAEAQRTALAARHVAATRGTLGIFGFSYYEGFEDQLRPMEIDDGSRAPRPNCVFPSQQTVSDASYPLARQILLTVSLRTMRDLDVNRFLAYAVRHAGAVAREQTLVALPGPTRDAELGWLSGERAPDVVYYPPGAARAQRAGGGS